MDEERLIQISFPSLSPAGAARAASELTEQINQVLREEGLSPSAAQRRVDESAQDIGQLVQIVLAAPAVVTFLHCIAIGIQKYISRTNRSDISIRRSDGTQISISNTESRDIAKVLATLGPRNDN